MPYSTQVTCPTCHDFHDVYVDEKRMIPMDARFVYRCPNAPTATNEALGVYTEVPKIPEGAIIAKRA